MCFRANSWPPEQQQYDCSIASEVTLQYMGKIVSYISTGKHIYARAVCHDDINIFRVIGPLWGESTFTKANDAEQALVFSLICTWTNRSANNQDAGNLRRHPARYDVTVVIILGKYCTPLVLHASDKSLGGQILTKKISFDTFNHEMILIILLAKERELRQE